MNNIVISSLFLAALGISVAFLVEIGVVRLCDVFRFSWLLWSYGVVFTQSCHAIKISYQSMTNTERNQRKILTNMFVGSCKWANISFRAKTNRSEVRTVFFAGGGASRANSGAAGEKTFSLSVCLRSVRLWFACLARRLLLFDFLRGLSVSHGDLLLVQSQGVGGLHCFPTPRSALHRGLWHLHTREHRNKTVTYKSQLLPSTDIWLGCLQYLINVIAKTHLFFLGELKFH